MIDYHCHLLPAFDDGPATTEESIDMAYLLTKAGYDTVYCTPHMIKNLYDENNSEVKKRVKELQKILENKNIPLKLLYGREYCLDNYFNDYINDLMPLENTNYILIEFQPVTYSGLVRDTISSIIRKGYIPMIAHPERCRIFHDKINLPDSINKYSDKFNISFSKKNVNLESSEQNKEGIYLLEWLLSLNCAFQNNIQSSIGVYGAAPKITAENFKKQGIYTHFGTDAHSPLCINRILHSLPHNL